MRMGKRLGLPMLIGFGCTEIILMLIQFCMLMAGKSVVAPAFAARFPSETAAVLAQLLLVGMIGVSFAGGAQIFEIERWSFLKQGIVHFLITAAVWVPVAWICWAPIPKNAMWTAIAGWVGTYAIIWGIQYFIWKKKVRELNRNIRARREEEEHGCD